MLDWLTGGWLQIGGYAYYTFLVIAFATWVPMTLAVRYVDIRKNFWILARIVAYSMVGAFIVPFIIAFLILSLKGQGINFLERMGAMFSGITSWTGFLRLAEFLSKGYSITAGVLVLGILLMNMKDARRFLFAFLYPLPLFAAIIRLGCLSQGCCYGRMTDSPLSIVFPPGSHASGHHKNLGLLMSRFQPSLPVHPVQLYISVGMLIVFITLIILNRKRINRELIAGLSLLGYGTINFNIEFLREEPRPFLQMTGGQWLEIGIMILSVYVIRDAYKKYGWKEPAEPVQPSV